MIFAALFSSYPGSAWTELSGLPLSSSGKPSQAYPRKSPGPLPGGSGFGVLPLLGLESSPLPTWKDVLPDYPQKPLRNKERKVKMCFNILTPFCGGQFPRLVKIIG